MYCKQLITEDTLNPRLFHMLLALLSFVITGRFRLYLSQFRLWFWSNPYVLPWSSETTLKDNGEQIISRKQTYVGGSKNQIQQSRVPILCYKELFQCTICCTTQHTCYISCYVTTTPLVNIKCYHQPMLQKHCQVLYVL